MTADSHLRTIADLGLSALARHLPEGWSVRPLLEHATISRAPQEAALCAPNGRKTHLRLTIARHSETIDPEALRNLSQGGARPLLVIAPSFGNEVRQHLAECGINLVDLAGNIRMVLTRPLLSIDVRGSSGGERPKTATARRLTGSKTARVVRVLCDFRTPTDCASVARQAGVTQAHARRVVRELARQGVIVLSHADTIESTDWGALLRRWSDDRIARADDYTWYAAPRGIGSMMHQLQKWTEGVVISGSWAANIFAPVAPKQMLLCYVEDERRFAQELNLCAPAGRRDVAVTSRYPDAVMERVSEYCNIRIAALSQIAADLMMLSLDSEADPLLEWMRDNESVWRR